MKPSGTASVPQRARRSAVACTPPKRRRLGHQLAARRGSAGRARRSRARSPPAARSGASGARRPRARRGATSLGCDVVARAQQRRPRRGVRARALEPQRRAWPASGARARPRTRPGSRPTAVRQRRSASDQLGVARRETAPSSTSEWPESVLVPLIIAKSAPSVERALAERRGQRVVDREQRARGVRGFGHGGDVAHVQARVRRRLDPHERARRAAAAAIASVSVGTSRTSTPRGASRSVGQPRTPG